MKNLILVLCTLFYFASCSSKKVKLSHETNVKKLKHLDISGKWYKDKKNKVDFLMLYKNNSQNFVYIPHSDVRCFKGKKRGSVRVLTGHNWTTFHAISNIKKQMTDGITINPDEEKEAMYLCSLGEKVEGKFRLVFKNIYKSLTTSKGDKKLVNIARNVKWSPEK